MCRDTIHCNPVDLLQQYGRNDDEILRGNERSSSGFAGPGLGRDGVGDRAPSARVPLLRIRVHLHRIDRDGMECPKGHWKRLAMVGIWNRYRRIPYRYPGLL